MNSGMQLEEFIPPHLIRLLCEGYILFHRKKGEIESTRCMNGECIGVIFASETTF